MPSVLQAHTSHQIDPQELSAFQQELENALHPNLARQGLNVASHYTPKTALVVGTAAVIVAGCGNQAPSHNESSAVGASGSSAPAGLETGSTGHNPIDVNLQDQTGTLSFNPAEHLPVAAQKSRDSAPSAAHTNHSHSKSGATMARYELNSAHPTVWNVATHVVDKGLANNVTRLETEIEHESGIDARAKQHHRPVWREARHLPEGYVLEVPEKSQTVNHGEVARMQSSKTGLRAEEVPAGSCIDCMAAQFDESPEQVLRDNPGDASHPNYIQAGALLEMRVAEAESVSSGSHQQKASHTSTTSTKVSAHQKNADKDILVTHANSGAAAISGSATAGEHRHKHHTAHGKAAKKDTKARSAEAISTHQVKNHARHGKYINLPRAAFKELKGHNTAKWGISTDVGAGNSIKAKYVYDSDFLAAGTKFHVSPNLLAAIFYGGEHGNSFPNPNGGWATSYAGAKGGFQFEPYTWPSYAQDGNGDGVKNPENLADASFAAADFIAQLGGQNTVKGSVVRTIAWKYNEGPGGVPNPYGSYADNVESAFQKFQNESPQIHIGNGQSTSHHHNQAHHKTNSTHHRQHHHGHGSVHNNTAPPGYDNTFRYVHGLVEERDDQGSDTRGKGLFMAWGPGVIVRTSEPGWDYGGYGAFIVEKFTKGIAKGYNAYVAEACVPVRGLHVGEHVTSRTALCRMIEPYADIHEDTGVEDGWASADGKHPESQTPAAGGINGASSCIEDSIPTRIGLNYNRFMKLIGSPTSKAESTGVCGVLPPHWKQWKSVSINHPNGGHHTKHQKHPAPANVTPGVPAGLLNLLGHLETTTTHSSGTHGSNRKRTVGKKAFSASSSHSSLAF